MSSSFEPTFSSSLNRASVGPSAADSIQSINFGFDDLRDKMAKFTVEFDTFIEQGRKRVFEERTQFRRNMSELKEDQRMKKQEIEIIQLKTSTHQQTVTKEAAETHEMESSISALTTQRDRQQSARDQLAKQIADTQREIDVRFAAQQAHARRVEAQKRFDVPELDFWTTNLGLSIEGAGADDRLKFVFTHVDERDWEREAWFELSTGARDYDVMHCRPKLERKKVEEVLDRVNESRELVVLLKGMRELFVDAMKS